MFLLFALLSVASGQFLSPYSYYVPHPYHYGYPRVYAQPYFAPISPPQNSDVETAVARSDQDFRATFRDANPRFLITYRSATLGATGAGTLAGSVSINQNFFIPNNAAFMTIKLNGLIPANTGYFVAILPTATATAAAGICNTLTAIALTTNTADAWWTTASLPGGTTPAASATGEVVGVMTTGGFPSLSLQGTMNFMNADGSGTFPAQTRRYPTSLTTQLNTDYTALTIAADSTAVASGTYGNANGATVVVWQLGTGGLSAARTAATVGCGTLA